MKEKSYNGRKRNGLKIDKYLKINIFLAKGKAT
jgi:hypothetical protein